MAKKQTKKAIGQKWSNRIRDAKKIYLEVKKTSKIKMPAFEKTPGYKYLKGRKEIAFNRYANRDKINQRERSKYQARKEIKEVRRKNGFLGGDEMTVFEAFSGKGRIFEEAIMKANEGKEFFGEVEVVPYDQDPYTRTFFEYATFKMYINNFLKKMYEPDTKPEKAVRGETRQEKEVRERRNKDRKQDSYKAFRWSISREYHSTDEKLIVYYTISEDEPE